MKISLKGTLLFWLSSVNGPEVSILIKFAGIKSGYQT